MCCTYMHGWIMNVWLGHVCQNVSSNVHLTSTHTTPSPQQQFHVAHIRCRKHLTCHTRILQCMERYNGLPPVSTNQCLQGCTAAGSMVPVQVQALRQQYQSQKQGHTSHHQPHHFLDLGNQVGMRQDQLAMFDCAAEENLGIWSAAECCSEGLCSPTLHRIKAGSTAINTPAQRPGMPRATGLPEHHQLAGHKASSAACTQVKHHGPRKAAKYMYPTIPNRFVTESITQQEHAVNQNLHFWGN